MKYTIVLVFFTTIVAVSIAAKPYQHVLPPKKWVEAAKSHCFGNISKGTLKSFLSGNKHTATEDAKKLALCYYTYSKEFVNGRFNAKAIANLLRQQIGSHPLRDEVVTIYCGAAAVGNLEPGSVADKAYAYHAVLSTPDNIKVLKEVFHPLPGHH